jgi:hypothetical protein
MPNPTDYLKKMSAKRVDMLKTSMDANDRDTDETSMKRHIKGVKDYVNGLEEFDESKLQEYFNNYTADDDNFEEIEEVKKPKRTLSPEQLAKMKAGREAAKAARGAAAAEKADEAEEKPKNAKAKSAKA